MSSSLPPGRQPPAFVPTLTRVVDELAPPALPPEDLALPVLDEVFDEALDGLTEEAPAPAPAPAPTVVPAASPRVRVRMPQPEATAAGAVAPAPPPQAGPSAALVQEGARAAEQIHARLLQRVDVILQRRVRETAARIALEYAQDLLVELRPAIEKAVLDAVNEALEMELHSRR